MKNDQFKPSWFYGTHSRIKSHATSNYGLKPSQRTRTSLFKSSHSHSEVSSRMDLVEGEQQQQTVSSTDENAHLGDLTITGPNLDGEGKDVIVIHPGSQNLRIGLASSSLPVTIPNVIARRTKTAIKYSEEHSVNDNQDILQQEVETFAEEMESLIKNRMKIKKLRTVPNAAQQVQSFNGNSEPEKIQEHNDPFKVEWLFSEELKEPAYFGEDAFLIAPNAAGETNYKLFNPVKYGALNWKDYKSVEAISSDIESIVTHALENEVNIPKSDFKNYNVVLIIPDLYERDDILVWIDILTLKMNFKAFTLMPESICATYGSGVLSACVVDIGAQKTSISCVEDGYIIPESRFKLNFGGDDVTRMLSMLFTHITQFPYREFNLSRSYDFFTMESLKEHYGTLYEGDIVVQHYECYVRVPHKQTLLYKFKVYDETMAAPMSLFYVKPFMIAHSPRKFLLTTCPIYSKTTKKEKKDQTKKNAPRLHPYYGKANELTSEMAEEAEKQETEKHDPENNENQEIPNDNEVSLKSEDDEDHILPLDNAIVLSIASTSNRLLAGLKSDSNENSEKIVMTITDEDRIKKMFNSILITGGGLSFQGLNSLLTDQLFATFYHLIPIVFNIDLKDANLNLETVQVMANTRNIDPQVITWKGGAISARLDCLLKDCWVSKEEWFAYGESSLKDRFLFDWV